MSDLTKKDDSSKSFALSSGKLTAKQSSFKQRVESAKQEVVDPMTMPNRLCLMLDCSRSMATEESSIGSSTKSRIDLLKEAVQNFTARCDFRNTAIAVKTFPGSEATRLSAQTSCIIAYTMGLQANGGTPLRQCIESTLEEVPLTRGVIVSDGGATDWRFGAPYHGDDEIFAESFDEPDQLLGRYKEQAIPLDCVHISTGRDGEELLRRIAKQTNGIFIKFTDVSAFSRAFGYLAPGFRAMLTSGDIDAAKLGAREVQK